MYYFDEEVAERLSDEDQDSSLWMLSNKTELPIVKSCEPNIHWKRPFKDTQAQKIIDGVYLGPSDSARDLRCLRRDNIKRIIIVAKHLEPLFPAEFEYLHIKIEDTLEEDLLSHLPKCIDFIKESKEKGYNVLIHCQAGVSRSASVCIAYVCASKNLSFEEGLAFVRAIRPCICPNANFQRQLKEFISNDFVLEPRSPHLEEQLTKAPEVNHWSLHFFGAYFET